MHGSPGSATNAALMDIHSLIGSYADALMRCNADDWLACWSAMPSWIIGDQELSGHDELLAHWTEAMNRFPLVIHRANPGPVVLDGGSARGRCTVQEILRSADGSAQEVFGVYHDLFEYEDSWVFRRRRFDVVLSRPIDLGEAVINGWPEGMENFLA